MNTKELLEYYTKDFTQLDSISYILGIWRSHKLPEIGHFKYHVTYLVALVRHNLK